MHEWACHRDETASYQFPIAMAFWIIQIVSAEECSSLTLNLMQTCCSTHSSHFECNGHTAHMLTQQRLPPPLTRTAKSSLFTHAHSSPLSLASSLHECNSNHCYTNNSWIFFPDRCHILGRWKCFGNDTIYRNTKNCLHYWILWRIYLQKMAVR